MGHAADHVELANRSQETLAYLLQESARFPEWITTVAFYKALHIVEAVFDATGEGSAGGHKERLWKLKDTTRFRNIHKHYRVLWEAASVARYLSDKDGKDYRRFSDYLNPRDVESQMIRHRLQQIEQSALPLLGPHAKALERAVPSADRP